MRHLDNAAKSRAKEILDTFHGQKVYALSCIDFALEMCKEDNKIFLEEVKHQIENS